MLTDKSFLRQVPHALEMKTRIALEGVGWAIDSISIAFEAMRVLAVDFDVSVNSTTNEHHLFVHCWSMVDQCHMLRSLLKRLPPKLGGEIEAFVHKTEPYTLIRNSMDHLPSMIENIVKSEKTRPPIFGALSFCKLSADDVNDGRAVSCTVVSVTAGSLTPSNEGWQILNPSGKELAFPVGAFEFEAFGHVVSLSDLMKDVQRLVEHFDRVTGPELDARIRAVVKKGGFDMEKHLSLRGGGGLKIALKVGFLEADETP